SARSIWPASSRVGARTRARGRDGLARPTRETSGIPKARVLPEPVGARPQMSRPARAAGIVAAWIGNGSVTPWSARREEMSAETPRSVNVAGKKTPVLGAPVGASGATDPIGHLSEAPGISPDGVAATAGEAWPQKGRGFVIPERPVGFRADDHPTTVGRCNARLTAVPNGTVHLGALVAGAAPEQEPGTGPDEDSGAAGLDRRQGELVPPVLGDAVPEHPGRLTAGGIEPAGFSGDDPAAALGVEGGRPPPGRIRRAPGQTVQLPGPARPGEDLPAGRGAHRHRVAGRGRRRGGGRVG